MKIETTRFGALEVPDDKVITMPNGLLGFADKRRFCMFKHKEDSPFFWYQSLEDPALAFVITNPWFFKPDYRLDLAEAAKIAGWEGNEKNSLECYVIVTIPRGAPEEMTANLMGPVIVNPNTLQATQIVLPDESYSHKHRLLKQKAA